MLELIIVIIGIGSIVANISLVALVFKLYTEYFKESTIKRRYENKLPVAQSE